MFIIYWKFGSLIGMANTLPSINGSLIGSATKSIVTFVRRGTQNHEEQFLAEQDIYRPLITCHSFEASKKFSRVFAVPSNKMLHYTHKQESSMTFC